MASLALLGGHVITPLKESVSNLLIIDGKIDDISVETPSQSASAQTIDASGCYVTPGLLDLQVNGAEPCDFWGDPTADQVQALCERMLRAGVTSFLPTLITDDLTHMSKNISFLQSIGVGQTQSTVFGARLPGIHLEGPCLSPQRPGVHPPQWLQPLAIEVLQQIVREPVILVTAAPELDPDGKALGWLKQKGVTVALGHSNATFAEASTAFARGVGMMTHTYNALPPLHHRAPGAVGAAMLDEHVSCCVICDGLHVDPDAVRILLRIKGVDNTILVTDIARVGTAGGGLVGSSIYLDEAVRNVVAWKAATFSDAVKMATFNPARALGLDSSIGLIDRGRNADLVVWDKETLAIKHVIVGGAVVSSPGS
jgi:N-acetylglucosamine-6-phosphate deacetylase